ncbi:uncharacterized protein [Henckelia pumila]|uniref:uncharacterized protein n=1 Tax=Henckelia pumila TaxID=405737 RepID=UPI003C6E4145
MAIGAFCGVAPFLFRKKLFRNQKKSASEIRKAETQPKGPESEPRRSSAMDIKSPKVSSSYGVATIPESEPRRSSAMDIRSPKVNSSHEMGTIPESEPRKSSEMDIRSSKVCSSYETELKNKISSFRDSLDLSPCVGSASVHELLILTLKDLLKLYPHIDRDVSDLEIEDATMHKAIKLLCDALKSLGDVWAKEEWMIQCKYDSSMEYEYIDLEQLALGMLDDMIKLERERMFDSMDEDEEMRESRRGTTTFEEALSESYSDSKMSVSSSPETPTSVLSEAWKASTQMEKTPYSVSLLLRPRVLAVRKLNPVDVKHLSLDMFPHTVVQDPRYLVQLGETGKEDKECKMRGTDINEVNHNLETIERINDDDRPDCAVNVVDTIKETLVKLSPPTPPPVAPLSPNGLILPSMTLKKLDPSPPPTPCVKSQKTVPTPPPLPQQTALRHGSPPVPTHVMSSERVSSPPPPPPPAVISSEIVSMPPPSPPQAASRNGAPPPPPPHVMSGERVYAPLPPPTPPGPHVMSSEILSAPPPPPGMTPSGAQLPTPPMAKGTVPPPPPGLGGAKNLRLMKSASKLKRSSQMGNLYRLLKGKVEGSSVDVKVSGRKGRVGAASGGKQGMADALAEMTKRSAYFQQIEEDVKNHAESIKKVKNAIISFQTSDMVELLKFYKYVESHLEKLTDETQVLARFEDFPTKKLEALRTAAALYAKLDSIASTLQNWPIVSPVRQLLDKAESFFNKIKEEIDALERTKDEEAKKFKGHKINFDFGILVRVKELMVDLSSSCMELALKEKRDAILQGRSEIKCERRNNRPEKILWRSFQFAFRVYSFAGGHDDRADKLTKELADEIETDPLH